MAPPVIEIEAEEPAAHESSEPAAHGSSEPAAHGSSEPATAADDTGATSAESTSASRRPVVWALLVVVLGIAAFVWLSRAST